MALIFRFNQPELRYIAEVLKTVAFAVDEGGKKFFDKKVVIQALRANSRVRSCADAGDDLIISLEDGADSRISWTTIAWLWPLVQEVD